MTFTNGQKAKIRRVAIEETIADAANDPRMLSRVVSAYVDSLTVEDQLGIISSEPETQAEVLGFDTSETT